MREATTVEYATSDGTATRGTLTFDAGEDEKTISVPVLDDAIDDDGETVILTLSNASAPTRITRSSATGTIENSDSMPKAWLVRFGRTVGSQVVDELSDRLDCILRLKRDSDSERKGTVVPSEKGQLRALILLPKNIIEKRFVILLAILSKEGTECREEE